MSNKTSLRRNFCKTKRSSPSHRPSSLCRCVTQNQCDVRPYRTRRTLASTKLCCLVTGQWSFLKTGTNGTLAGQAEIYVWFQTPGGGGGVFGRGLPLLLQGPGPPKKCHCIWKKSCSLVHFWPEMVRSAIYNAFLNTLTMRTTFPRVHLRNDRCDTSITSASLLEPATFWSRGRRSNQTVGDYVV